MKKIERNYNVTNALTPISGMTFKKTGFRMGDVFCQRHGPSLAEDRKIGGHGLLR
jgi:hypothetical protein